MTEALETVAGRRGWIISDGKTGNDVQTRGVFDALGLDYEVKRVDPGGIWEALSPWGPVEPGRALRHARRASSIRPGPSSPSRIGRLTTPYIRRLKRLAGLATYTVILQNPKVAPKTADLFWVPEHDTRRGRQRHHDADGAAQLHGAAPAAAARDHAARDRRAAAAARGRAARRPERRLPLYAGRAGAPRLRRCNRSRGSVPG